MRLSTVSLETLLDSPVYAATLLDSACGIAVHFRLAAGQGYTTRKLKVAYHRAMTARTSVARQEGKVVSFARRAAFEGGSILR